MRYLIKVAVTNAAGERIDRGAGPGVGIGLVLQALKPETFYVSVFRREVFAIADCDDLAVLSEAAHMISLISGADPEVTPIMTADEAMKILPDATARAVKAVAALSG
jgi:Domain of unknown function (DUF3303)